MRLYVGLHGVASSDATYAAAASADSIALRGTVSYGTQRSAPTEQRPAAANHAGPGDDDEIRRATAIATPCAALRARRRVHGAPRGMPMNWFQRLKGTKTPSSEVDAPGAAGALRIAGWRRHRGAWTAAGILAVVLAILAAAEVAGWPFLRGPLQRGMQSAAGVPVTIDGDFRLRLFWQPGLTAERLVVGPAHGIEAPHLLAADAVALRWRWGDVWRFRQGQALHIQSLEARHADAWLLRLADGRATWQLGAPESAASTAAPRKAPVIDRLQVATGRVQIEDAPLQLQLVALVQALKDDRDGAMPGLALTAQGSYRALPLKIKAQAAAALPLLSGGGGSDAASSMTALSVDAQVARTHLVFSGEAAALLSASRLNGALDLSGPSLAAVGQPLGLVLPETPPFKLRGHIARTGSVWSLVADSASIGSSALAGAFSYETAAAPSRLSGRLTGSRLALKDLGPAIGADRAPTRAGRVLPDQALNLPSLSAMDANVLIDIDLLDLGTAALAPLRQVRTHLRMQKGALQLDDLSAVVAGGRVSGSSRLQTRAAVPQWTAALKFSGLDVAGWVQGVRTPAAAASSPDSGGAPRPTTALKRERQAALQTPQATARAYVTGVLDAQLTLAGQGRSVADIFATLNGETHATVRDGTLSHLVTEVLGLDVAEALGVVLRGDRSLPLRCARLDAPVRQGVMLVQHAVLDNADSTVKLGGQVNLRDETLALRIETQPKDFSPLSLRTPITLGGTLDKPAVSIDASRIGVRALAALALAAVAAPVAALIPFVDAGKTPDSDPCAPKAVQSAPPAAKQARPKTPAN